MKRVCPLLEREGPTRLLSYAPAPWVPRQCLETGFVFLENPPEYESLNEQYAWEVTSKKEAAKRQTAEPLLYAVSGAVRKFRAQVLRRKKIRALALTYLRGIQADRIQLLDIGCGRGSLLVDIVLRLPEDIRKRCVPQGIEISKEQAQASQDRLCRFGGQCIHDNAFNAITRFPSRYFDQMIMSSFLEHEINPLPLLERCREHLRPNGHIIVKVPNFGCLNRRVRGRRWCGFRWPDHVNYFTPDTLTAMAAYAGFRISRMNFFDRQPFSDNMYAVLQRLAPRYIVYHRSCSIY